MDPFQSALDLAAAIKAKDISPLEVVQEYLGRIDRLNPQINAFIWRRDEELLAEARAATEALSRGDQLGPFHGVPIPIKDLNDVAGWPTTYGSKAAKGRISEITSSVVEYFKEAGFLLMGRTNTPEIGTLLVTENDLYGATRNPWNLDHTPGGSSGGASAALAAGMCPIAHGNDGGGSLRIPGSCAGLVGFKPSRGRVPCGPPVVSDVMHGGAVEGVITRTVADTAALLDVMTRIDPLAWYNAPAPERPFAEEVGASPGRLRIAFTDVAPTGAPVSEECKKALKQAVSTLEGLGHDVFEATPDWGEPNELLAAFLTVWNTGTAYWPLEDWDQLEPCNAAMREISRNVDSITYLESLMHMQNYCRRLVSAWGRDFDVLVTPTLATEPPRVGELFEGVEYDPLAPINNAAASAAFTPVFNSTGQPAVSLPLHWAESGLPIGVQFVGKPWGEAELIRLASQVETASPWADKRPPVS